MGHHLETGTAPEEILKEKNTLNHGTSQKAKCKKENVRHIKSGIEKTESINTKGISSSKSSKSLSTAINHAKQLFGSVGNVY